MDPRNPHGNDTEQAPTTAAVASPVDARLERIEQSLKQMSERLPKHAKHSLTKGENRAALATAFASIGAFTFAALGGKVGFFVDWTPYAVGRACDMVRKQMGRAVPVRPPFNPLEHWENSFLFAGIGALTGLISGGLLGYMRGDRLDEPEDLFKRPSESLKKMFGKAGVQSTTPEGREIALNKTIVEQQNIASGKQTITSPEHEGVVVASSHQRSA